MKAFMVGIPRFIVGATIFVSIALNLANILGRYLFQSPIVWVEEILVFLMVWSVFIGAVLVTWEGRHLKMDLLSAMMPAPYSKILNFSVTVLCLAVCGLMAVESWGVTRTMAQMNDRSPAAGIPMFIPHLALFLGFAGMFIAV